MSASRDPPSLNNSIQGKHTGLAIIKDKVPGGELLVADRHSRSSTVEGQVVEEAAGPVFDEKTDVHNARPGGHVEDNVLQAGGLRGRPVHARGRRRRSNIGRVNDKVADLTVEDIGRVPIFNGRVVVVAVNKAKSSKVGRSLERRWRCGISDELSKVR
jgi:hypothetical protein